MGEFLEHFGGIIVAIIVATLLSAFLIFTRDNCNNILANQVIASAECEQEYSDVNGIITEDAPELDILDSIVIEEGDDFNPEDAVISAYNSDEFRLNEISGNAAKNITNIKKSLVAGLVNVVYPEDFSTNIAGNYTIIYYVKNDSKGGLWTRRNCRVSVVQYEITEEKG